MLGAHVHRVDFLEPKEDVFNRSGAACIFKILFDFSVDLSEIEIVVRSQK